MASRLFADENFPLPVVRALRSLGHDVLTIQEHGLGDKALGDERVLATAHQLGRGVLTLNRKHFWRLHDAGMLHSGIIACTFDREFDGQARRIDSELQRHQDLVRAFIRVNRPG